MLSIAHTSRILAQVIVDAFSETEPSEVQRDMVAGMAERANHLEHLDALHLTDLTLFERSGVAAAVVRDFERRALAPIRAILYELWKASRPSESAPGPEPLLDMASQLPAAGAPVG